MRLLLDTSVLSEVTRPRPDAHVLQWLDGLDEDRSFISVVSIAEIRRGVALMESGRKRDALTEWLVQDLPQRFEQRVISVDQPVAIAWGDLMGLAKRSRRGISSIDGLIAATAIAHDLTLATRNIKDFEGFGIELVDPWTERP
ncbi:PIN domain-containing protein [Rhizobium leguminosarum bv. viciae]|uniref:type II toxin-antitoxin system VapC family toxin n=1 Tax=Rhizobium leguminosarum TaxID=384 RepID=UPI001441C114|nr:type II toxin-antitoxin system VapC family toxin [Rhizobium leguminosarum]NKK91978.1 PIN domain-containing protein [Rhizobium leguminosarum bv. viciae]